MHPTIRRSGGIVVVALLACFAFAGARLSPARAAGGQPVAFVIHAMIVGPASVTGTWAATGAIQDSGTETETFHFSPDGRRITVDKVLVGAAGTIVLSAHGEVVHQSATFLTFRHGRWDVDFGTGAYAGLRGGGRPGVTADSFVDAATGEVSVTHAGFVRG